MSLDISLGQYIGEVLSIALSGNVLCEYLSYML